MTIRFSPGALSHGLRHRLSGQSIKTSTVRKRLFFVCAVLPLVLISLAACAVEERQSGIPSKAQEAIATVTDDFAAGRYEKIYAEAADEWRARATLEESNENFRKLKDRLGAVKERTFLSGRQQQNAGGDLPANSLIVRYNTTFTRAGGEESDGMETFTLIERDGRYQLAGYAVSSDILK